MSYLCHYHNNDGDTRGWNREESEISCQACRAESMRYIQAGRERHANFTLDEIKEYEQERPDVMQTHKMEWNKSRRKC